MSNLWTKEEDTSDTVPLLNNVNPEIPDSPLFFESDKEESEKQLQDRNLSRAPSAPLVLPFSPEVKIVVALYSYNTKDRGHLKFRKGDRLGILDDSDPNWWRAYHVTRLTEGFFPRQYVALENTIECEDWFFGRISSKEAEKLLMDSSNPLGTFLIRISDAGFYALCVLDWEYQKGDHLKKFIIHKMDSGDFYLKSGKTFATLQDLVSYYSEDAHGICRKLTVPCPRLKPPVCNLRLDTIDKWENTSRLKLIKMLRKGIFGDVWYGLWKGTTHVAVKTVKPSIFAASLFLLETTVMKKFQHENLIRLHAVRSWKPHLIITEYMVNRSLLDYLRGKKGRNLNLHALVDMAAQIASGMAYLGQEQLIHRNLTARNILVGHNNVVKVSDFKLSLIVKDLESTDLNGFFPIRWTPPEAAILGKFSIKSDVWSYGILLYELFTYGQDPYPGMSNKEVIEQVARGYRMPKPTSCECPDSVYTMMLDCWNANPQKRPTFEFLFSFFKNYFVLIEPSHRNADDF